MTGKDVVDAVIAGFEGLFDPSCNFKVKVDQQPVMSPSVRRCEGEDVIIIPQDLCLMENVDDKQATFILLTLSHELAHIINKHNNFKDQSNLDSKGIELWADYFGMRIAMTIICYSAEFKACLSGDLHGDDVIELLADAGLLLAQTYYCISSPKYPNTNIRVQVLLTGITTFFTIMDEDYMSGKSIKAVTTFTSHAVSQYLTYKQTDSEVLESMESIKAIHLDISNGNDLITEGVLPQFSEYISTRFV